MRGFLSFPHIHLLPFPFVLVLRARTFSCIFRTEKREKEIFLLGACPPQGQRGPNTQDRQEEIGFFLFLPFSFLGSIRLFFGGVEFWSYSKQEQEEGFLNEKKISFLSFGSFFSSVQKKLQLAGICESKATNEKFHKGERTDRAMSVHPCDFVGGGGKKGLRVSRDPFGPRGLLIPLPLRKNRFDLCNKVERRSGYLHFLSLFPYSPQPAIFRVRTEYNVPVSCKNCFLSVERDEGRKENFQSVMSEKRKICFLQENE